VTKVLLLAVIGGEAVLDEIVASTVAAGDDFDNHALTLTRHLIIQAWHTTQAFNHQEILATRNIHSGMI